MKNFKRIIAGVGAATLAATMAACSEDSGAPEANKKSEYTIVFLAASSQNGYNQAVYKGIKAEAKALSSKLNLKVKTKIQDGQFDANTQLSQLQNAGTTGKADAVTVVPQDGAALNAAFPLAHNIPVVSVLNPIGPDISDMKPQVDGVVSTVASPPSHGAKLQAEAAVEYCKNINPCKIGLLAGLLNSPLDVNRVDTWKGVLKKHSNIKIVGTVEGAYDRDKSVTVVGNMLQANKDINGIISNADQQTLGAQIALEDAGISPKSVFLTGGGGTEEAVKAVKEGKWTNDFLNFPVTMGKAATEQTLNSLRGKKVKKVVDADSIVDFGPIVTKKDLDAKPEWTGEWNG